MPLVRQHIQPERPMHRTYVPAGIGNVCEKTRISRERRNSQALRKLYLRTKARAESNAALPVEQMMEREPVSIGWGKQ